MENESVWSIENNCKGCGADKKVESIYCDYCNPAPKKIIVKEEKQPWWSWIIIVIVGIVALPLAIFVLNKYKTGRANES